MVSKETDDVDLIFLTLFICYQVYIIMGYITVFHQGCCYFMYKILSCHTRYLKFLSRS